CAGAWRRWGALPYRRTVFGAPPCPAPAQGPGRPCGRMAALGRLAVQAVLSSAPRLALHPRKCPGDGAGRALLGELPHGLLEAAAGDGVHPAAHDLLDHGDRLAVLPDALGLRVEPGVLGEALDEPTQADGARLLVVVL